MKLTKPITALLYITADKQHMEKLKHAIHTKENNEGESDSGKKKLVSYSLTPFTRVLYHSYKRVMIRMHCIEG